MNRSWSGGIGYLRSPPRIRERKNPDSTRRRVAGTFLRWVEPMAHPRPFPSISLSLSPFVSLALLVGCAHHAPPAPDETASPPAESPPPKTDPSTPPNTTAPAASPSAPPAASATTDAGPAIWPADATQLLFDVIPVVYPTGTAGDCMRGAATYTLDRQRGALVWSVCPETGPAVARNGSRQLAPDEMKQLDLAMTKVALSHDVGCAPGDEGKPHLDFDVLTPTASNSFMGPTSSCAPPPPPTPPAGSSSTSGGDSEDMAAGCGSEGGYSVQNVDAVSDLLAALAH
jgi:hypothetical protein